MRTKPYILLALLAGSVLTLPAQRRPVFRIPEENQAMIVVTGLRLAENDPTGDRIDRSVAEGATVEVVSADGVRRTKTTERFRGKGSKAEVAFHTADFSVNLAETYQISITFRDGTTLRIPDYRLEVDWKTHFYFHSTNGTKSPASVLRTVTDPGTGLEGRVYAVFPYESYQQLGGSAKP